MESELAGPVTPSRGVFGALLLACALAGCGSNEPSISRAPAPQVTAPTVAPESAAAPKSAPADAGPKPKIVVEEPDHDFGFVDFGYEGSHVFTIRNLGNAPLTVDKIGGTCSCLHTDFASGTIDPGGVGQINLEWSVRQDRGAFRQSMSFRTNDPAKPEIRLSIFGVSQVDIAHEPAAIQYPDSPYGLPATTDGFVYSQLWTKLEIVDVTSDLPKLTWKVTPLEHDLLKAYHAKAGYRLSITASEEMTTGFFEGNLKVRVRQAGSTAEPREIVWRVAGGPVDGIWLTGDKYDVGGAMIGPVSVNRGGKIALTMKAKNLSRELLVEKIETNPPFLVVRAVPIKPQGKYIGLFRVELEVPPGSPPCTFMAPRQGQVRIVTNNPGNPVLSFPVEFAVLDE